MAKKCRRKAKNKVFTVVLLYPDYSTLDYGGELYVESTTAKDEFAAAKKVQKMAYQGSSLNSADDLRPILVLAGDCRVVASAEHFEAE